MLSSKRFMFCSGLVFLWIMFLFQFGMGTVHQVSIIDFAFDPDSISIAIGDSVTWTNTTSSTPHTSTSDASVWNSGTISPGSSFSFHFTSNGLFPYHCNIHTSMHGKIVVQSSDVRDETGNRDNPNQFDLSQNYPNPFNSSTQIDFTLTHSGFVSLNIYDILGRKVKTLVSENLSSGYKSMFWDGRSDSGENISSGVYFYRLKVASSLSNGTGDFSETKKLLLLK